MHHMRLKQTFKLNKMISGRRNKGSNQKHYFYIHCSCMERPLFQKDTLKEVSYVNAITNCYGLSESRGNVTTH